MLRSIAPRECPGGTGGEPISVGNGNTVALLSGCTCRGSCRRSVVLVVARPWLAGLGLLLAVLWLVAVRLALAARERGFRRRSLLIGQALVAQPMVPRGPDLPDGHQRPADDRREGGERGHAIGSSPPSVLAPPARQVGSAVAVRQR